MNTKVAWRDLREALYVQDAGCCVVCGLFAQLEPGYLSSGHAHHRLLRSRGGQDDAWNVVWLCLWCHEHIHANPAESTRLGLMCPSGEEPDLWPVRRQDGWFQPTPHGWVSAIQRADQDES